MTPQTLGTRLAQLRREKAARDHRDVTQVDVAKAAGVSKAAVSRYESGVDTPRERTLERIADFLETTPEFLRYGRRAEEVRPAKAPTRADLDAVRERQQAKRNAAKKAVAGDRPGPKRPPKPR